MAGSGLLGGYVETVDEINYYFSEEQLSSGKFDLVELADMIAHEEAHAVRASVFPDSEIPDEDFHVEWMADEAIAHCIGHGVRRILTDGKDESSRLYEKLAVDLKIISDMTAWVEQQVELGLPSEDVYDSLFKPIPLPDEPGVEIFPMAVTWGIMELEKRLAEGMTVAEAMRTPARKLTPTELF